MRSFRAAGWTAISAVLCLSLLSCGDGSPTAPDPAPDPDPPDTPISIPARGTTSTFDVATWNLQFFGSPSGGPADDLRQRRRVRDVILGTQADLWGVQEVSDASDFEALLAELPGYAGLLANDPSVTDGPAFYNDFGGDEHKVGVVFRSDVVELVSARLVLTELDFEFAGRPPLELRVRVRSEGTVRELTVVVLHAKAAADEASWTRRHDAAVGLKTYLDDTWPTSPVFVIGDWNDDVDTSITQGRDTPYRIFVDDDAAWTFTTASLSAAGQTSILGFDDMIDHILSSDEAAGWVEDGSVEVYRVDVLIPDYGSTTSDHLPVLARFRPEA